MPAALIFNFPRESDRYLPQQDCEPPGRGCRSGDDSLRCSFCPVDGKHHFVFPFNFYNSIICLFICQGFLWSHQRRIQFLHGLFCLLGGPMSFQRPCLLRDDRNEKILLTWKACSSSLSTGRGSAMRQTFLLCFKDFSQNLHCFFDEDHIGLASHMADAEDLACKRTIAAADDHSLLPQCGVEFRP